MQLFRQNGGFYKADFSKSICFCNPFKQSAVLSLYIFWVTVAEIGPCRPADQLPVTSSCSAVLLWLDLLSDV